MKPEGSLPFSKDPTTNGRSRGTRIQSVTTHSISWRATLILYFTSRTAPMPGEEILYGGSSVWNLRHVTFLTPMLGWPPGRLLCGPCSHLHLGIPRNAFLHVTSSKAPRIYHLLYFEQRQNIQSTTIRYIRKLFITQLLLPRLSVEISFSAYLLVCSSLHVTSCSTAI
jgi:hypothetical protein